MNLCKTITAQLLTYAAANLNLNFMGYEDSQTEGGRKKVFLDENEYLEIDLVDYNGLQYTTKTGLGSHNQE